MHVLSTEAVNCIWWVLLWTLWHLVLCATMKMLKLRLYNNLKSPERWHLSSALLLYPGKKNKTILAAKVVRVYVFLMIRENMFWDMHMRDYSNVWFLDMILACVSLHQTYLTFNTSSRDLLNTWIFLQMS